MSTDYFREYQSYVAPGALASPAHTPEDSPTEHPKSQKPPRARKQRDFSTKSAPVLSFDSPESQDGNVYGLDPNRFTPTLHASLVSEILTLRRELESKHNFIDGLEESLKTTQAENEDLSTQLRESNKKSKQVEQRYRHLENGTFDAVEGLLSERDSAQNLNHELRSRLDSLSKKVRQQEEDAARSYELWEKEKQTLNNEKRRLEQKFHVSESRIKRLVEEMSIQQATLQNTGSKDDDLRSIRSFRTVKHTRNQSSSASIRSIPRSIASIRRPGMSSLANELNSDDDYETEDYDQDDDDASLVGDQWSTYSRSSAVSDSKAKKILGLTNSVTLETPNDTEGRDTTPTTPTDSLRTSSIAGFTARLGFQKWKQSDGSRTSSRSASPVASRGRKSGSVDTLVLAQDAEPTENNQGSDQPNLTGQPQIKSPSLLASRRGAEAPISPPETPICATSRDGPTESRKYSAYQSMSTQTDVLTASPDTAELASRRKVLVPHLDVHSIPFIEIHPPLSTPSSPRGVVLPPGMTSVSVQTEITASRPMKDSAVQTEDIRIDTEPVSLPPRLLPSALEPSPSLSRMDNQQTQTTSKPRAPFHRSTFSKDGHRLPLKPIELPPLTLLEASGDAANKRLDADDLTDGVPVEWPVNSDVRDLSDDLSDPGLEDVFGHIPGLARPGVRSMFQGPPRTVPEDRAISPAVTTMRSEKWSSQRNHPRNGSDGSSISTRPSSSRGRDNSSLSGRVGPGFGSYDQMRPSSSGSHSVRTQPPPFPIPHRSSSRPPSNMGSDGPASPSPFGAYSTRSRRSSRESHVAPISSLRKVQSSNAMKSQKFVSPRRRRRAPGLEPIQSMAFEALPIDQLLPAVKTPVKERYTSQNEGNLDVESPDIDKDSAVEEEYEDQDNVIVDAIAATMVGEWMWKYTRRRRSFGIGERDHSTLDEAAGTSGVRHKRWVWLSPYEHTVMWSAKQPNSGPALLGKNGRKLIIKSVLDVKDATPLPKSVAQESVFDRSILILTPARALKLTATSKERHYLWLTALSFLAQSGRGPPQVPRVTPIPEHESGLPQKQRQPMIRNSKQPVRKAAGPRPTHVETARSSRFTEEDVDSAEPPNISRLSASHHHQRKRSHTNPQLPAPDSSFMPSEHSASISSAFARRSSSAVANRPSFTISTNSSRRTSVAGSEMPNVFEAVGTIRMEAFIGQNHQGGALSISDSFKSALVPGDRGGSTPPSISTRKGYTSDENDDDPFEEF